MIRFRVLMMMTALLATATVVHAQSPRYFPPADAYQLPKELQEPEASAPSTRWYIKAL